MVAIAVTIALLLLAPNAQAQAPGGEPPSLEAAQLLFYNGRYAEASAASSTLCISGDVTTLTACELRLSSLLFQLRRALDGAADKEKALLACAPCGEILATFTAEQRRGQALARAHLEANPADLEVRFLLGKIDLNYVWLQLGTIGRKTGWDEYWEARKSLDAVLKQNPQHIRAKVARAWIDYIVDTRMPRMTKWLLGGGSRKKGIAAAGEAAATEAPRFVHAEAVFALWDMQVREKALAEAVVTARGLAVDFPDNPEVRKFLDTNAAAR